MSEPTVSEARILAILEYADERDEDTILTARRIAALVGDLRGEALTAGAAIMQDLTAWAGRQHGGLPQTLQDRADWWRLDVAPSSSEALRPDIEQVEQLFDRAHQAAGTDTHKRSALVVARPLLLAAIRTPVA